MDVRTTRPSTFELFEDDDPSTFTDDEAVTLSVEGA